MRTAPQAPSGQKGPFAPLFSNIIPIFAKSAFCINTIEKNEA